MWHLEINGGGQLCFWEDDRSGFKHFDVPSENGKQGFEILGLELTADSEGVWSVKNSGVGGQRTQYRILPQMKYVGGDSFQMALKMRKLNYFLLFKN